MRASQMSPDEIRRKAAETLKQCGAYRLPVNLDAVAAHLGVAVNYQPLEDDYSGLLVIRSGHAVAHINSRQHPNRQRFSLAHELGHFVLHEAGRAGQDGAYVDKSMRLYLRSDREAGQDARAEFQANLFASELLMPEQLLRSKILDEGYTLEDEYDVSRLAVVLKVSEQALSIRLTKMPDLLSPITDEHILKSM